MSTSAAIGRDRLKRWNRLVKRTAVIISVVSLLEVAACGGGGAGTRGAETAVPKETSAYAPTPDGAQEAAGAGTESGAPPWADQAVLYEVNVRQYTPEGTFKAFAAHLPRLKELGADILWFMPIHPISVTKRNGTLGSYYAVDDYKAVNPEFGTAEDFKVLVEQAHGMGFKIMLDWVANHTGWDNPWTQNPGWYSLDKAGNIIHPAGTNWTDVADLNYGNADMQAAMLDAMKVWVTEYGVDGFRCDYAGGVPTAFWEKARAELGKIKSVYMLAEDDQNKALLNRAFDANYGWGLYNIMNRLAKGLGNSQQLGKYGERLDSSYPRDTYPLNFTSNHDENSWTGTEYERLGDGVKTMAALTFLMPGMPLIYSGQEAGLNKRLAFFEKDEISWDDLSMQAFYQQLIRLKHENTALWNGAAGGAYHGLESGDDRVLAFARVKDGSAVFAIMNLSKDSVSAAAAINTQASGTYKTFPNGDAAVIQGNLSYELEPWEYRIFVK